jgi:hypothetical protein
MAEAPKVEIRIRNALGLTKKQAKHLQDQVQNQLAEVLQGAAALACVPVPRWRS